MRKATREQAFESLPERSHGPAGRATRLGSYTYLPAPARAAEAKGRLVKGGLPVSLEVSEGILRDFMEAMSCLEKDLARRWVGMDTRGTSTE